MVPHPPRPHRRFRGVPRPGAPARRIRHRTGLLHAVVLLAAIGGPGACSHRSAPHLESATAIPTPRFVPSPVKMAAAETIRVATYNIKHGRGLDGVIDLARTATVLEAMDADLIALQEVDEATERSGGVNQAAWLARRLNRHVVFGSFMDFQGGRYGLAILSRMPIESHDRWSLPDGHEPRVALAAHLRTATGSPLTVVAVHFDWVEDDGFRFDQARATLHRLVTLTTPWIVLGDFNDVPDSRTLRAFEALGRNCPKPPDTAATFPADEPALEIDFIIAGPPAAWKPTTATVLPETRASDHRPVVADLQQNDDWMGVQSPNHHRTPPRGDDPDDPEGSSRSPPSPARSSPFPQP